MASNATSFSSPLAQTIFPISNLPPQLNDAIDAVTNASLATWFFTILALAVVYDQGMCESSCRRYRRCRATAQMLVERALSEQDTIR